MNGGVLDEAYERLHHAGPEWGADQLTNHDPMAVEVLVRRGHEDEVHRWVDRYIRRLEDLPSASDPITDDTWREALGDGRRIGDWTAYLTWQVNERPWPDVLVTWWPRLVPGIVAGATYGVIRVSHAVRALRAAETGIGPAAGLPAPASTSSSSRTPPPTCTRAPATRTPWPPPTASAN